MRVLQQLKRIIPKRFLWRLTLMNVLVIAPTIGISSWAVYNTACFLVEGSGYFNAEGQLQFNRVLYRYLWLFSLLTFVLSSLLQFYFTKKLIAPIRDVIESTKTMKKGEYPDPIRVTSEDEIGELVAHYNELIQQLRTNDTERKKHVADLSHEIRTPLANVNGYLHALKSGIIEADKKLFESLYEESNRLTTMVQQLDKLQEWDYLAAQKITQKETVEIEEQLTQCIAMFSWRLEQENIPLIIDVQSESLFVYVAGIQQVLSNLLENAIDYYRGTGAISIKGEARDSMYIITVSGPGEKITNNEKLFERFYRGNSENKKGSGLGLAIVKEIVENSGGEVGFAEKDGNNCFWFTIEK